jgi:hypothetical protein
VIAAPLFEGAVHAKLTLATPAAVEEKTTILGTFAGVLDEIAE